VEGPLVRGGDRHADNVKYDAQGDEQPQHRHRHRRPAPESVVSDRRLRAADKGKRDEKDPQYPAILRQLGFFSFFFSVFRCCPNKIPPRKLLKAAAAKKVNLTA
jgi:hypothetical protein